YPLSGQVALSPDAPLAAMLAERGGIWGAVGDPEVLQRLGLNLGGRLRLGSLSYELRGIIPSEPDRGADAFLLGQPLMGHRARLNATLLCQPGILIYHLYRLASPPGLDAKAFLLGLARRFPDAGWRIRELDDASPGVKRFIDRTAMFLTLVGLSTLLIGGVGIGNAVKAYLESKTSTIAILKCGGAPAGPHLAPFFAPIPSLVL